MDDFIWVLVFIFFVVAPLLESVLKGGSRSRMPPDRRPQGQRRAPPAQRDAEMLSHQRAETRSRTAEDMLPAELWEILTGQKSPAPRPLPAPRSEWDEEADRDEESAVRDETLPVRTERDENREVEELLRHRERAAERQTFERAVPRVVSMESAPVAADVRHRKFHEMLARTRPAPAMEAPPAARNVIGELLRNGTTLEVRRAILMHEVLGRPKGLD